MFTHAAAQALHDAIAHEDSPEDKVMLSKALQIVLQVQQKNMAQEQAGGGAPGGAPGGQPGGVQQQALLGALGALGGQQ